MKDKYFTDREFKPILKGIIEHIDRWKEGSKLKFHLEKALDTLENNKEDIISFSYPVKESNPLYKIIA